MYVWPQLQAAGSSSGRHCKEEGHAPPNKDGVLQQVKGVCVCGGKRPLRAEIRLCL